MGRGGHSLLWYNIKEEIKMPIYEYECLTCGTIFEAQSSIKNRNTREYGCTKCKGIGKRIISKSSFILKGSGWEKDGYSGISNRSKSK